MYYLSNHVWSCETDPAGRAKHSANAAFFLALLFRQRLIAKRWAQDGGQFSEDKE